MPNKETQNHHQTPKTQDQRPSILVTGAAGFIGSHFIRYILSEEPDLRVINLDKLTYAGNIETLKDINAKYPNRYSFIQGDICDEEIVDRIFHQEEPDKVINFAAESHVDRSFDSPNRFFKTNVEGLITLLEVAKKHWDLDKNTKENRFLQISTDKVYGSLLEEKQEAGFKETDKLAPSSPYAASKASAEHVARSYYNTYDLPILITRSPNVYGPYQYPEKLIPVMVMRAKEEKKLPIYGDGNNVKEWIYVEDVCEGLKVLLNRGDAGQVYNIGSEDKFKNIDIVEKILSYLDKNDDLIHHIEDRLAHDRRCALDSAKIKSELAWEAKNKFEVKLEETIDWYLDNLQWVKRVS